jgi:ATP-dependent Clp protease adapter protein ClpS
MSAILDAPLSIPDTIPAWLGRLDSTLEAPYRAMLWNDDVHAFDHVVAVLVRVVPEVRSAEQAHEIAMTAHLHGRAVIVRGGRDRLAGYRDALEATGLTVTIEPEA